MDNRPERNTGGFGVQSGLRSRQFHSITPSGGAQLSSPARVIDHTQNLVRTRSDEIHKATFDDVKRADPSSELDPALMPNKLPARSITIPSRGHLGPRRIHVLIEYTAASQTVSDIAGRRTRCRKSLAWILRYPVDGESDDSVIRLDLRSSLTKR